MAPVLLGDNKGFSLLDNVSDCKEITRFVDVITCAGGGVALSGCEVFCDQHAVKSAVTSSVENASDRGFDPEFHQENELQLR